MDVSEVVEMGQDLISTALYLALPTLQWLGMAYDKRRAAEAGVAPFPAMRRWLREAA